MKFHELAKLASNSAAMRNEEVVGFTAYTTKRAVVLTKSRVTTTFATYDFSAEHGLLPKIRGERIDCIENYATRIVAALKCNVS